MTKTQRFNQAYRLAFQQMMSDEELLRKPSGLAARLQKAVAQLMKDDSNPTFVAVEAVARLKS